MKKIVYVGLFSALVVLFFTSKFALASGGRIDSEYKFAWSENAGWINFGCDTCNVQVTSSSITGYAWSKNFGWINLAPTTSGIKNDGNGNLSGFAWGENLGWIDFENVLIDNNGRFTGTAVGVVPGVINFDCPNCQVRTSWRAGVVNNVQPPTPISEQLRRIPETIRNIFRPRPPTIVPPTVAPPVDTVPLVFQGRWQLLTYTQDNLPLTRLTLAPLPLEIRRLAEKFPDLGDTFAQAGINQLLDVQRLRIPTFTLPGLTQRVGLPIARPGPENLVLPSGVPVAQFPEEARQKIPTDFVFARTGSELIDIESNISVTNQGEIQQSIRTVVGSTIQLVVRPDRPVNRVKGYLIFHSREIGQINQNRELGKLDNLTLVSSVSSEKSISLNAITDFILAALPSLVRAHDAKEVETWFVKLEFEYTDPDNDGIFTAEIQSPVVGGKYEVVTVFEYKELELGSREIRLVTLIDPEGYIYEKRDGKETRIPNATASIYWLNPETERYQLWPAEKYQQINPQITDYSGTYSFLVPEGSYYLKIEASGYQTYQSKPFLVKQGRGVHMNIELRANNWWLEFFDWRNIGLVVLSLFLLYYFYRERKRKNKEKLISQSNNVQAK